MVVDSRMPSAVQNTSLSVSNLQKQSSLLLLNDSHAGMTSGIFYMNSQNESG